jgi:hypothetical protein
MEIMTLREVLPSGPKNAHDFLALFQQLMPQLWTLQHNHGTRSLRTLLDAAERLKMQVNSDEEGDRDLHR